LKVALFTKFDVEENNDHIFSVIKSLINNKISFDIDRESYETLIRSDHNIQTVNFNEIVKLNDSYDLLSLSEVMGPF